MLRTILVAAALLGTLSATDCVHAQRGYAPTVGKPHAEITLPRIDTGQRVSLSDYLGKKVLLIHFASW